mmetsp:Transcript_22850/g.61960  ORF Transcript_22850/g.61960 Transcript_22850/m.61960 type:complete len:392 (+) Transcript_22850:1102-2277(+)
MPPRQRVHARGGLVEEDHVGGREEGDAQRRLALVASGVGGGGAGCVCTQPQAVDERLARRRRVARVEVLERRVEGERLARRHPVDERVCLGAVADARVDLLEFGLHVKTRHTGLPYSGSVEAREHLERGALARAVDAQQAKALAPVHAKRQVAHGELGRVARAPGVHLPQRANEDGLAVHICVLEGADALALGDNILVLILDLVRALLQHGRRGHGLERRVHRGGGGGAGAARPHGGQRGEGPRPAALPPPMALARHLAAVGGDEIGHGALLGAAAAAEGGRELANLLAALEQPQEEEVARGEHEVEAHWPAQDVRGEQWLPLAREEGHVEVLAHREEALAKVEGREEEAVDPHEEGRCLLRLLERAHDEVGHDEHKARDELHQHERNLRR